LHPSERDFSEDSTNELMLFNKMVAMDMYSAVEMKNDLTNQKRILVVDDYPQIRNLIREALENEGDYEVNEAENGLEALNLLKKRTYDIVISDVMMPIMGGTDLLESIK